MKSELQHQTFKVKRWWFNMNNRVLNYLHIGEDNHMRFIHMNEKCRLDRTGVYPRCLRWG